MDKKEVILAMRRSLRILSLLLLLLILIAAVPIFSAPVKLQFGIYADPARQKVAEEQAEAFMKKHPAIEVKVVAVPYSD